MFVCHREFDFTVYNIIFLYVLILSINWADISAGKICMCMDCIMPQGDRWVNLSAELVDTGNKTLVGDNGLVYCRHCNKVQRQS